MVGGGAKERQAAMAGAVAMRGDGPRSVSGGGVKEREKVRSVQAGAAERAREEAQGGVQAAGE